MSSNFAFNDNHGLFMYQNDGSVEAHFHAPQERPETPPSPFSTVPFMRDPDAVHRSGLLDLIQERNSIPRSRIALVGLGGIGKSHCAIEYSYLVGSRSPSPWVFWIHANTESQFVEGLFNIANKAKIPGRKDSRANIFNLVENWLQNEKSGKWILILDNADDLDVLCSTPAAAHAMEGPTKPLFSYIPVCAHGSVIITTRTRDAALKFVHHEEIIPVDPMDESESLELLQAKLGRNNPTDLQPSRELVGELEFIPLAIVQAASYIRERRDFTSVSQYLKRFRKSDWGATRLLEEEQILFNQDLQATGAISLTWQISFDHIQKKRPSAADLLSLMCFCDRQAIPQSLIRHRPGAFQNPKTIQHPSDTETSEDEIDDDFKKDLITLKNFSLISVLDRKTYTMHHLVQLSMRSWLRKHGRMNQWVEALVNNLHLEFPTIVRYETFENCRSLSPHVESVASHRPDSRECQLKWAEILCHCANYTLISCKNIISARNMASQSRDQMIILLDTDDTRLSECTLVLSSVYLHEGLWQEATSLLEKSLAGYIERLGVDHSITLKLMYHLALAFEEQWRHDEAKQLQVQIFGSYKDHCDEIPDFTLPVMLNLGCRYREEGKLEEAHRVYDHIIQTCEAKAGDTAIDRYRKAFFRASSLWNQGHHSKAENCFVEALDYSLINEGSDHPKTLTIQLALALIYNIQCKWQKAQSLYTRVIEGYNNLFGRDNPNSLSAMSKLASTHQKQGQWKQAEYLQEQVTDAYKTHVELGYSPTINSMSTLAAMYSSRGRLEDASHLEQEIIEKCKSIFGADHPKTLMCISNLAGTYSMQKMHDKAECLRVHIKEVQERTLGLGNIKLVESIHNLSVVYQEQGKSDEANQLLTQTLDKCQTEFGEDHPSTLACKGNLASMYTNQCRWKDALLLLYEVTNSQRIALGKDHRDTLGTMDKLLIANFKGGFLKEAAAIGMTVMEARKVSYGEDSLDTIKSMNHLAMVYVNQERFSDAEKLLTKVINCRQVMLGVDHPDTLQAMYYLAETFAGQGRLSDAEKAYQRIILVQEAKFGSLHPDTMTAIETLASFYVCHGRWAQAEALWKEIAEFRETKLGTYHTDTLRSMDQFLKTLILQERMDEAEKVGTQILEIRTDKLGVAHPGTIQSMSYLVRILLIQDRLEDAGRLGVRVIEACRLTFGEWHSYTLLSMSRLARIYLRQDGRLEEADNLQSKVVEKQKEILGVSHPGTLESMRNLAVILEAQGRGEEAKQVLLQENMPKG